MISTTTWPASWNSRSFCRTTVWPRWMSGAVGSIPNFTRSGRPFSSCRSSAASGRASTAFLSRNRAASPADCVIGAMLDCRPLETCSARGATGRAVRRQNHCRTDAKGPLPRATSMQEPHTPTLLRTPTQASDPIVQPDGTTPSPPRRKPQLKKLRLALILFGLAALALVSTVFGMLMAVASDLPALENQAEYKNARNSKLYPDTSQCRKDIDKCPSLATLTGNSNRILLT